MSDTSSTTSEDSSSDSEDGAHPLDHYLQASAGGKQGLRAEPKRKQPKKRAPVPSREDSDPESGELPGGVGAATTRGGGEDFEDAIATDSRSPSTDLTRSTDGSDDEDEAPRSKRLRAPSTTTPASPKPPPTGVKVLAEGEQAVRNAEVDRLLRQPR
jgi:hypothetical protein